MTQPKLGREVRAFLDKLDCNASLYQPTSLFPKDGRKLPNCPVPSDPWKCYIRANDGFGIVAQGIGFSPDVAVLSALYMRPGLRPAMKRLGDAIGDLAEALHACQN